MECAKTRLFTPRSRASITGLFIQMQLLELAADTLSIELPITFCLQNSPAEALIRNDLGIIDVAEWNVLAIAI